MRDNVESIGLALAVEDVYSLAAQLGVDAQQASRDEFGVKIEELEIGAAVWLRDMFKDSILRKGENSMSAQTNNSTAAQIPNTEAYSTNFYFDIEVDEGNVFSAQMTVRGGQHGGDHLDRVLGAMRFVIKHGGSPQRRGRQAESAATPAPSNASNKWEWTKGDRGKNMLVLRGDAAEPNEIPCPVHDGKMLKRKSNDDGAWLSHKSGEGYCSAGFKRV